MFIHIGAHKTGSTYLQKKLLPLLDCEFYPPTHTMTKNIINTIDGKISVDKFNAIYKNNINNNGLVSEENIFGNMSKAYWNFKPAAQILKKIFPNAKIIITIRKQDKWIESAYKNFIHHGWPITFDDFLSLKESSCTPDHPQIKISTPDWLKYIKYYEGLFGEDNILVLCQEELKNKPIKFMRKMTTFMNINPLNNIPLSKENINKGLSKRSCDIASKLNKLIYKKGIHIGIIPRLPFKSFASRFKNKKGLLKLPYYISTYCDPHLILKYIDKKYPSNDSVINPELQLEIDRYYLKSNEKLKGYGIFFN